MNRKKIFTFEVLNSVFMEENQKQKHSMPLLTKISIVFNIVLFGITGIIYLVYANQNIWNNTIGFVLLGAGFTNVLWLLVTKQPKNMFFVVLNFIFSGIAIIVAVDYLMKPNNLLALLWFAITLYYMITGFIIMMQIRKKQAVG